jgi:hypothetical protein
LPRVPARRGRFVWCETPRIAAEPGSALARRAVADSVTACFRRNLDLATIPGCVPARVSADSRYALFVNGAEVSRGPVRANGRRLHYDRVDLAPFLRPGRNAIAALVRFFGRANPWWAPVPRAELGAGGFLFEARLGDAWLVSDAEWRALRADAWQALAASGVGGMPIEVFDAGALAADWQRADFDDSTWQPARVLAANHLGLGGRHEPPIAPLRCGRGPRPIALLTSVPRGGTPMRVAKAAAQAPHDDPVATVLGDMKDSQADGAVALRWPLTLACDGATPYVVTIDFGEIVSGTVTLDLDAPAGARIDVAAAEFAGADGRLDPDDERSGFRYLARAATTTASRPFNRSASAISASRSVRMPRCGCAAPASTSDSIPANQAPSSIAAIRC